MAGYDSYVKLLLHYNGTNESTTIVDETGKTVESVGMSLTTADKVFGSASGLGNPGQIQVPASADFNMGTGNFTIDWWMKNTNTSGFSWKVLGVGTSTNLYCDYNDSGYDYWIYWASNGSKYIRGTSTAINDGAWHHHAIVRNSGTMYYFIDGYLKGSNADADYIIGADDVTLIFGSSSAFTGKFDELRISKGIARWTSEFTPPTEEYSAETPAGGSIIIPSTSYYMKQLRRAS